MPIQLNKLDMAKYNMDGHYSKERIILIIIKKYCGCETFNLELLDMTGTIQSAFHQYSINWPAIASLRESNLQLKL